MNLLKTSFLSSIATVIKIITGFVVNKVLAIYIGPTGIAQMGNLQNFYAIVSSISNASISQGVTKYVSFYSDETVSQKKYINAAITISVIASIITGILVLLFNIPLSVLLLNSREYNDVFIFIGISLILFSINSVLIAIVNGFKDIRKFTIINVISSFFSLFISVFMTLKWELIGAMYGYVLAQSIILFITLFILSKEKWLREIRLQKVSISILRNYSNYTIMAVIHIITAPVSFIIIRNYITHTLSLEDAGYWNSIVRISDTYLMFITMTLSVYYLPRLAEIKDNYLLKKEIINGYKLIIPILTVVLITVYLCRDIIIVVLYSGEFLVMRDLFLFQLIGDFFKIASWLISFNMVVKEMTKLVIVTELFYSISLTSLSLVLINSFGLVGVTYAYAVTYFLYFLLVLYLSRQIIFLRKPI
jgi:polysaccharide transporter, PST family